VVTIKVDTISFFNVKGKKRGLNKLSPFFVIDILEKYGILHCLTNNKDNVMGFVCESCRSFFWEDDLKKDRSTCPRCGSLEFSREDAPGLF